MGFFDWFRPRKRETVLLPGEQECIVVGDGYYKGLRPLRMGSHVFFELRREPRNRYDKNAISVWAGSVQVGYLSESRAADYAATLDALGSVTIHASGHIRKAGNSKAAFVMMPDARRPQHLIGRPSTPEAAHRASARPKPSPTRRPVNRSEFLTPENEARFVRVGDDDFPNLRLERERGQLVLTVPQGMVNFRSRSLYKLGIYTFRVRGAAYYEDAARAAALSPGSSVRLVREPDNPHDPNAVAIYPARGVGPIGYVNRQNAARLAKLLDAGEELAAITMSGSPAGRDDAPITILVARPPMIEHLRR